MGLGIGDPNITSKYYNPYYWDPPNPHLSCHTRGKDSGFRVHTRGNPISCFIYPITVAENKFLKFVTSILTQPHEHPEQAKPLNPKPLNPKPPKEFKAMERRHSKHDQPGMKTSSLTAARRLNPNP